MKRYITVLACLLAVLILASFKSPAQKVYDHAGLLSKEEAEALQRQCENAIERAKADLIIVTVQGLDGKSAMKYADDFFNLNGFGYEKEMGTGALLLVAMESRDIWLSTSGRCIETLPGKAAEDIVSQITPYFSEGEYAAGFAAFLSGAEEYIQNGGISDGRRRLDLGIQLLAAAVIGGVAVWIMLSGSSSKMTAGGYTYAKTHKGDVRCRHDVFVRTTTIRRTVQSSSGGSGGIHTGRSGSRHGGSGGKF